VHYVPETPDAVEEQAALVERAIAERHVPVTGFNAIPEAIAAIKGASCSQRWTSTR